MSTLIVEICEVKSIKSHPNADRLVIATVKGWETCIGYDPSTGQSDFKEGDKCVYFPPDSILPPELANSPHRVCKNKECDNFNIIGLDKVCEKCGQDLEYKNGTPGRLGIMPYCAELPKQSDGTRLPGGRVKASRLRGYPSYGFIMAIDPKKGDDPNWEIGQDVKEHFGVTKWEPPEKCLDGDAEVPNPRFHTYTEIENFNNFPNAIEVGEEVIFSEKIHGKNCRLGIILDSNENGDAIWKFACGSHEVRRKEFCMKRIKRSFWKNILDHLRYAIKLQKPPTHKQGEMSEFWKYLTENVKNLLHYIEDNIDKYVADISKPIFSIIIFGEIYGSGVQDMQYGLTKRDIRCFDIAVNRRYLDFEVKEALFKMFGIEMVPVLYRGPFSTEILDQNISGPTVMCSKKDAGPFKGREGVVITPVVERRSPEMEITSTNGRVILKAISADYLARKNPTDSK